MMAGVGARVGLFVHWTGVTVTGFGGVLLGIYVAGTMVTLGGNAVVVSFGNLEKGVGQYFWIATAGVGRGVFRAGAAGGLAVTLEKMREIFWMAEN